MENYKSDFYNPETFEKSEVKSKIPSDLVLAVEQSLNTLNSIDGYFVTPIIVKPEDSSVVFGVINNETKLKYRVSITPYE
jgi:hypothetical protein